MAVPLNRLARARSDQSVEIVTGGYYSDNVRLNAQLCVWSGSTLTLEEVTTWYWVGSTFITSVSVGDVDGSGSVEIITSAYYEVSETRVAQFVVWALSTAVFHSGASEKNLQFLLVHIVCLCPTLLH